MPVTMTTRQIERAMVAAWSVVQKFKSDAITAEVAKTDCTLLLSVSVPESTPSEEGRLYIKELRTLRVIHQPGSMGFYTSFVKVDRVRYNPGPTEFFILLRWPIPSDAQAIIVEPAVWDLGADK